MVAVKYSVDDAEVNRLLGKTEKRIKNPEKALKECGLVLIRSIAKNFKAGGRPIRWKPSKRAISGGGKTLIKTARLKNSITMDVFRNLLKVGTNVKYAAAHQFGAHIKENVTVRQHWRYMEKAFGKSIAPRNVQVKSHSRLMNVKIEKREFLKVQDSDVRIFKRIIGDYVTS